MNKKQIVLRVKGGLGNQLFQFNLGELISSRLGICVKYDIKTGYLNDGFNRSVCFFSIFKNSEQSIYRGYFNNLLNLRILKIASVRFKLGLFKWFYYNEDNNINTNNLFSILKFNNKNIILEGYWQNTELIDYKFISMLNASLQKPFVNFTVNDLVIHYRSDNFANSFSFEYYDRALKFMLLNFPHLKQVFIYSDSNKVLKLVDYLNQKNDIPLKFDFNDYEPFTLLSTISTSKYFIPSYGTFSLWALLLGKKRTILLPPSFDLNSFYKFKNVYIKSDK